MAGTSATIRTPKYAFREHVLFFQTDVNLRFGNSRILGDNPLSEWKGTTIGHGPTNHFDVLLKHGAGGRYQVPGDYLFRDQTSHHFDGGMWGIFRVMPAGAYNCVREPCDDPAATPANACTVDPETGKTTCP